MILADLGDENQAYLAVFTALLPISVFFVPLIGWVVERFGLGGALHCVNALGAAYAACSLVPSLPFQLLTFAVYTNYRAMLFSVASVYTARCFGPSNVGRVHGMCFSIAAAFSFWNYGIVSVTNSELSGDFTLYSMVSALITVPLVPLVCWVDRGYLMRPAAVAAVPVAGTTGGGGEVAP